MGPSGRLLREHIRQAGLDWDSLFIANAAKCMINKSDMAARDITKTLECCRAYLEHTIMKIKPEIIITCGDIALRQILGKSGITKLRGIWERSEEFNCRVMSTLHPAYILRNRTMESLLAQDLKAVSLWINP